MPAKKRPIKRERPAAWKPNKTVLVTGASGGIGFDLASLFAQNGYNVVLVARRVQRLNELAHQAREMYGVSARVLARDLSDPSSPESLFRSLQREGIEPDILVNNAGFGLIGPFAYSSKPDELAMIRLNIQAAVHLTKLFLPGMIQRGRGHILNVASTAGFQPGPLMANYYATKAYLISFSVAIAEEVRRHGVSVSVLCPGPTATGFQARAGIRRNPLMRFAGMDSRIVARAGYEGLMAGKTVIVPGILNKVGTLLVRMAPPGLVARLVGTVQETKLGETPRGTAVDRY